MSTRSFVYINGSSSLSHAYESQYYSHNTYSPSNRTNRYKRDSKILKRASDASKRGNPYGNYKSPYYDPVARHERYMQERASLGIGKGTGLGSSKSSGSGGSGKGSSSADSQALKNQVKALREESTLNTEAQREAAKRKIEDLKSDLTAQIQKLKEDTAEKTENSQNLTEIRGATQTLKSQIENLQGKTAEDIERIGTELKNWISQEKDSLERRIAALYKSHGKEYTVTTQSDKQSASTKRDKEVTSRADSIYKKKSK